MTPRPYTGKFKITFYFFAYVMLCLSLASITSAQSALRGTTVIAVRTPTDLIVGADSKGLRGNNQIPELVCKIRQANGVFYSFSGVAEDPESGFNLPLLAAKAAASKGTIQNRADKFEQLLQPKLLKEINFLRRKYPSYFEGASKDNLDSSTLFFGLENGVPVLVLKSFTIGQSKNGKIELIPMHRSCPGVDCELGYISIAIGHHNAINNLLPLTNPLWKAGLGQGVRRLVEIEIKDEPRYVGYPIDIVAVGRNGTEWLQGKPQCRNMARNEN